MNVTEGVIRIKEGIVYGYARCSTDITRQDINRQKRELHELGVKEDKHIYWEYESGTKEDRAELEKLLAIIQPGDTIACTEVSRLTRREKQLCDLLQLTQDKHIRLVIGSFCVDCRNEEIDVMTKGMLMMWGVFAEMERDIISQRVRSGLLNAKAKGKVLGRPKLGYTNLPKKFLEYYPLYKSKQITITAFADLMHCSRSTIYKYLKIYESEA